MSGTSAMEEPFVARLEAHARAIADRRPVSVRAPSDPPPPVLATGEDHVAFWQSPVVRGAINRRITGNPNLSPESYFATVHGSAIPGDQALSLRAGDARLEVALLNVGACERVVGLDTDAGRLQRAIASVPDAFRSQLSFRRGALAEYEPAEPFGAVVARSVLHRQRDLEGVLDRIRTTLLPGGLLFVDDFIGPARFQWTDAQLKAINRLLACLPEGLLTDLTAADGRRKRVVMRPSRDGFAASNPEDAVRSDEILRCLDERLERVEVHLYGGAVYHQLFTRIMGNFAGHPELVRVVMEVDAMLTDSGVLGSDYVWGVWRRST